MIKNIENFILSIKAYNKLKRFCKKNNTSFIINYNYERNKIKDCRNYIEELKRTKEYKIENRASIIDDILND